MKLKHLRFAGLLFGALFLCPAHAQTPSGSVSRSTWVNTTLGQCFPTNNQGLITASVLRNCMTTLADSVLFSQSALSDLPTGPSTMPSGFTYPSPFVSGTFTVNGSSSGAAAIVAQAAAGSPTLTLPTGSGTFAVSASSPLSLNTATGALTCATCQTMAITGSSPINVTSGVVSLQGASGTLAQGSGGTGSSFTATPTLGVAGSTLGTLTFANLTSGGITLAPPTGALGSVTLTLPDTTTTLAGLGVAQTFSAAQTFSNTLNVTGTLQLAGNSPNTAGGVLTSPVNLGGSNVNGQLPLTGIASIAADNLLGNFTGSSAAPQAGALVNCSNALTYSTTTHSFGCNSSAGTGTVTSGGGGIVPTTGSPSTLYLEQMRPGGRLTLASGVPVMTSTVSAGTTLYYAPYNTRWVPIYNGTQMQLYQFTSSATDAVGLSLALGSNWTTGTLFDVYVTLNAGSPALCTVAWTNGTTRATTLGMYDGLLTNSASATCRNSNSTTLTVAANQGTYLGTFYTVSAGAINYVFGASASGGTAADFGLWNYYNRVVTPTNVVDSGTAYSYTLATVRQARGSAGNQISFVVGVQEDGISASYMTMSAPSGNGVIAYTGLGLDSLTAFSGQQGVCQDVSATANNCGYAVVGSFFPTIGRHTLAALESTGNPGTATYDIVNTNALSATFRQ